MTRLAMDSRMHAERRHIGRLFYGVVGRVSLWGGTLRPVPLHRMSFPSEPPSGGSFFVHTPPA